MEVSDNFRCDALGIYRADEERRGEERENRMSENRRHGHVLFIQAMLSFLFLSLALSVRAMLFDEKGRRQRSIILAVEAAASDYFL